ncbi:MAG: hypothetical protein ACYTGH_12875, partial [Planctomycetota bacterium]
MSDVTIGRRRGRPVIRRGSRVVTQNAYCDYIGGQGWEERIREFCAGGTTVFHIRVPYGAKAGASDYYDGPLWSGDNTFPRDESQFEWSVSAQMEIIQKHCPRAQVYIKFLLAPPTAFFEKHPEERQTDEDGTTYRQPTLCAPHYRRQLRSYLKNLLNYCESLPWSDRILGYLGMPIGEGITPLTIAGKMFDVSGANEKAFLAWAKKRYKTVAALRKAWGEPTLSFSELLIPRDREWLAKRDSMVPTLDGQPYDPSTLDSNCRASDIGLFHWTEEADTARVRDYCRFMRETYIDWLKD